MAKVHASKYNLDNADLNLLDKIARKSKMDCWFSTTDDGYFYDCENNRLRSPKTMTAELIDGMTDYDYSNLNEEEQARLEEIKIKINY